MKYVAVLFLITVVAFGLVVSAGCGGGGGSSYTAPQFDGDNMPAVVDSTMTEGSVRFLADLRSNLPTNGPPLPMPSYGDDIIVPLAALGCKEDSGSGNVGGTYYLEECYEDGGTDRLIWSFDETYSAYVNTSNVTMLTYTTYRGGSITGEGTLHQTDGVDDRQYLLDISAYSYRTVGNIMGDLNWMMDGIMSSNHSSPGSTQTTTITIDFAYNDYDEEEFWWVQKYTETEVLNGGNYTLTLSGSYCSEGCLSFRTLEDLEMISSRDTWPESGVMVITGEGGASAKFTFTGSGSGTKMYDEDGDGVYEIGPVPFT